MGFFGTTFRLMLGGVFGVYVAQNYDVPNLRELARSGLAMAKQVEETNRRRCPLDKINDFGQDPSRKKI
ncbi:unnamed protein product [Coffea canephora]|uniref:Uncharacterized protein n=1 Tax=Coffea canephora TaxID=49390 RepID=A0A068VG11_COFCA|nr:unnamed protein product [Coffea canephora]